MDRKNAQGARLNLDAIIASARAQMLGYRSPEKPQIAAKNAHNGALQAAFAERARAQIAEHEARAANNRQKRARGPKPRATGPAIGYRPQHALPPPHMRLTRGDLQRMRLQERRARRDSAYFPPWLLRLADEIHRGGLGRELARVPRDFAEGLRNALREYATEEQRNSSASLAIGIYWLATRAPGRGRTGRVLNVAGIPRKMFCLLTRNANGRPYSVNRVFGGWHGRGPTIPAGPRGGPISESPEQTGLLRFLEQHGLLKTWIPPADAPSWMLGESGYQLLIVRPLLSPVARPRATEGPPRSSPS